MGGKQRDNEYEEENPRDSARESSERRRKQNKVDTNRPREDEEFDWEGGDEYKDEYFENEKGDRKQKGQNQERRDREDTNGQKRDGERNQQGKKQGKRYMEDDKGQKRDEERDQQGQDRRRKNERDQ